MPLLQSKIINTHICYFGFVDPGKGTPFFRSLHIVLFPMGTTFCDSISAAATELIFNDNRMISTSSRFVFFDFPDRNSNRSAKFVWLHSGFLQNTFRLFSIKTTFSPWIGKSWKLCS
jgi:hypothetical protein